MAESMTLPSLLSQKLKEILNQACDLLPYRGSFDRSGSAEA